jgi:uncharacterized OB-fold protein
MQTNNAAKQQASDVDETTTRRIPAVDYLVLADPPHLVSNECVNCGALYFDRRNACARCFTSEFTKRDLESAGTIKSFTIVQRAAPSVPVPYTSVVVGLDGGGTVKANLLDETNPDNITPAARVRLETFVAGQDDDGTVAVGFAFRLEGNK